MNYIKDIHQIFIKCIIIKDDVCQCNFYCAMVQSHLISRYSYISYFTNREHNYFFYLIGQRSFGINSIITNLYFQLKGEHHIHQQCKTTKYNQRVKHQMLSWQLAPLVRMLPCQRESMDKMLPWQQGMRLSKISAGPTIHQHIHEWWNKIKCTIAHSSAWVISYNITMVYCKKWFLLICYSEWHGIL